MSNCAKIKLKGKSGKSVEMFLGNAHKNFETKAINQATINATVPINVLSYDGCILDIERPVTGDITLSVTYNQYNGEMYTDGYYEYDLYINNKNNIDCTAKLNGSYQGLGPTSVSDVFTIPSMTCVNVKLFMKVKVTYDPDSRRYDTSLSIIKTTQGGSALARMIDTSVYTIIGSGNSLADISGVGSTTDFTEKVVSGSFSSTFPTGEINSAWSNGKIPIVKVSINEMTTAFGFPLFKVDSFGGQHYSSPVVSHYDSAHNSLVELQLTLNLSGSAPIYVLKAKRTRVS